MGERNAAYIDAQNLHLGIMSCGWHMDYKRFRVYLKDKYHVETAFMFLGYVSGKEKLYTYLEGCGFTLVFKEVSISPQGYVKGNVDVDVTLHVCTHLATYSRIVLITSDGDFAPLVNYLLAQDKLCRVLSPSRKTCSWLLRKYARTKVDYLDRVSGKLKKHP